MAQYDIETRHARLRATVQSFGPNATLEVRAGHKPANTSAPNTGIILVRIPLGEVGKNEPANGRLKVGGPWEGVALDDGDAGYFRIYSEGGACRLQGTIGTAGTDMIVDGVGCIKGRVFAISSFAINDPNG